MLKFYSLCSHITTITITTIGQKIVCLPNTLLIYLQNVCWCLLLPISSIRAECANTECVFLHSHV